MTGPIRALLRFAVLAGLGAWLADRWLRDRAGGAPPAPIRTSVEVDAPIDQVWARLVDIERQPDWMHDLRSVELLTPPPIGVGTRAVGRVRAYGIGVADPIEVTAFEPPTRYAIRHVGLVGGEGEIVLSPLDGGGATAVSWDETLVAPLFAHLGALVLAVVFRPIFQRDLERLADLVEAD